MTLVSEPSLRDQWHEVVDLLVGWTAAAAPAMLVFNVVGRAGEDRIRSFRPGVVTLGQEVKQSSLHAEIYWGPRSLYINLTTSLNLGGLEEIAELTGEAQCYINGAPWSV